MKQEIPLSRPDITDLEKNAVMEVLNTPNLSLGPALGQFEQWIAEFAGVRHAVAMSSGTSALHVLIRSLDIGPGDYVLTTPFSFIASSNCILFEGAEPIFVDINRDTFNLTPLDCENAFRALPREKRERVKAVLYVDVFGVPADGPGFEKLGEKFGIKVIEDSAEALGSSFRKKMCGSYGDGGVYAFYPNKQITTGEGGVLLTDDYNLAGQARNLRNQGRADAGKRHEYSGLGFNYRISDLNCALGIVQIKRISEMIVKRKKVKAEYDERFADLFSRDRLIRQEVPEEGELNPFVYVLRLSDRYGQNERDGLIHFLAGSGIRCSRYFPPIHIQPQFRVLGWEKGDMPVTEMVSERTIAFPFFNNLDFSHIDFICRETERFFNSL